LKQIGDASCATDTCGKKLATMSKSRFVVGALVSAADEIYQVKFSVFDSGRNERSAVIGTCELCTAGEVHGTVLMECRRCLKPTPQPVDAYFQHLLEFHPEVEELTLVQNEDDEDVYHFGEPDLDLRFFLAQAFALAMPYTALCDESCKGLCPVCGADLNVTDCGHVQGDAVSGALAELGKFLDEV
jgi:uncharacterized metal-binding protein YceD (DUF177 family)